MLTRSTFILIGATSALCGLPLLVVWSQPTIEPPRVEVDRQSCVTAECHANVKSHDVVHGPVNVNACDACHTLTSAQDHAFEPARDASAMCVFCHEVGIDDNEFIHEPLMTGDCMSCHDPHGGSERSMLRSGTPAELCRECHEDDTAGMSAIHGPVAAGACTVCHSPHSSSNPKLLAAEGKELCIRCHVSTETQLQTMQFVHGPVNVDCLACHDAHATNHRMMLKDEPVKLCESCHETIMHTVNTATTQHAAVTTEQGCMNCHDAHASDHPRILRDKMTTLCLNCHDREIEMPEGRKLLNMQAVLASGNSLHGPVAQDNCAACHEIHGGGNFRLLIREYPPEFYAPFKEESYALCFSCHDKEVTAEARTTALTDFRNGDMNLHYLHVNRDKKGRTCRACHETHASQKSKHIREEVPFGSGGWMLPINYEASESGGQCAPGCHVPYAYDRLEPVTYPDKPGAANWPTEGGTSNAANDKGDEK